MRNFRLTNKEVGLNNQFAMSKGEASNPAFVSMFETMIALCREQGWSQRRLCAALGKSESWLSKIKHAGQGMDLTMLIKICEVTGIPPDKLLSGYPCPKSADPELERLSKVLEKMPPDEVRRKILRALEDES